MNDELIFVKTPSGEDAVRDRTRLVQRNLRMVLILVDGCADVAALKLKAGDAVMTEAALRELERIGLIESTEAHTTLPAHGFVIPSLTSYSDAPVAESIERPASPAETVFDTESLPPIVATLSVHVDSGRGERPIQSVERTSPLEWVTNWWAGVRMRRAQAREERTYEKAYGEARHDEIGGSHVLASPVRKKHKAKVARFIALISFIVLILGAVRVVTYPYDQYRPAIEARLSKILDDDVKIEYIRAAFSPLPTLILERVRVGASDYATADTIRLVPEPLSLLSGDRFHEINVDGLHVRDVGLVRLSRWFSPSEVRNLRVREFRVEGLSIDLGWTLLGGLAGTAELDNQRGFSKFTLRPTQGDFRVEAVPTASGIRLSVKSGEWVAPLDPPVVTSAMELLGTLSPGHFVIDKVEARLYDGLLSGNGTIAWDGTPNMTLKLAFQHANTSKLLDALRAPALLDGQASGQVQLTSDGLSSKWLNQTVRIDGVINVLRGSLKRIDLAGALRPGGPQDRAPRGGDTGFEEFSGKFALNGQSFRLSNFRLSSGLMLASGQATVTRQSGAISGTANVEMRGSASAPKALLTISGSAANPQLKAAR
jgi:hypothetical protein